MRLIGTPITGAWLVEPARHADERGFFARVWGRDEFAEKGLRGDFINCNNSLSNLQGTLRGLHYQVAPHEEVKLVRCVRGRVFDVLVDMRAGSPTRGRWFGTELNTENRMLMYIPEGCAHGYLSLEDNCEVVYFSTAPYAAEAERGVRWNDPSIGIAWPIEPAVFSAKDRQWADLSL
jgi:dTDP-4-dehydrorhamnose 3,5-epimerase